MDRGYEKFESKLKKSGIDIIREIDESIFTDKEYKIDPKSEDTSKIKAA